MAIYHLRASVISRSAGRSATAAAAYRCATRIDDERTGLTFDYTGKSGVEHTEILAPDPAPDWVQDRSTLWNSVEVAETRKNSQVAREVRVALPCELNLEQRRELVRDFCQREFVDRGMVADIALHEPGRTGDGRNHHAHIMLTTREIDGSGFTKKNRDWNKVEVLEGWREGWSRECNAALERAGLEDRVDHRTLEVQRDEARERADEARERGDDRDALEETVRAMSLDRDPLPQLSPGAWRLKERGYDTAAAELWREAKGQAIEVARVATELAEQVRSWVERTAERARELLSAPEPELAGSRGHEDTPRDLADRLREAWNAREGPSVDRGGGGRGGGDSDDGPSVQEPQEERDDDDRRDLASRLREAAKHIDYEAAQERALEFQRQREGDKKDLREERALDRDEERRHLERERKRDRDRSRGR
jgi:hypothetical protein